MAKNANFLHWCVTIFMVNIYMSVECMKVASGTVAQARNELSLLLLLSLISLHQY